MFQVLRYRYPGHRLYVRDALTDPIYAKVDHFRIILRYVEYVNRTVWYKR